MEIDSRKHPIAPGLQGEVRFMRDIFSQTCLSSIFISQKAFTKLLCTSQNPHKSVDLSFIITHIKKKMTNSFGNCLCKTTFGTLSVRLI